MTASTTMRMTRYCAGIAFATMAGTASAQTADPKLLAAAEAEGMVSIYASADNSMLAPVFNAFRAEYPKVKIEYSDMNSAVIHSRFVSESAAGGPTADFIIQPAIDLVIRAVDDGLIQEYASPELPNLPKGTIYKNSAYALWNDPVCNFYNKNALNEKTLPYNSTDLVTVFKNNEELYREKVGGYDIEKSAIGFFYLYRESLLNKTFWEALKEFGSLSPKFYSSNGLALELVGTGELNFGYNFPCINAIKASKVNPAVGIHYYHDYAQLQPSIGMISKLAKHPNSAKLFLNFMLSKKGQEANLKTNWIPTRTDVAMPDLGYPAGVKYMAPDFQAEGLPATRATMDRGPRTEFLNRWKQTVR